MTTPDKTDLGSASVKITKWQMEEALGLDGQGLLPLDRNEIQAIRVKHNLSQGVLASLLNVGLGSVRQWEQGTRTPSGAALKLLYLLDKKGLELLL